jgi:hypothetical protein
MSPASIGFTQKGDNDRVFLGQRSTKLPDRSDVGRHRSTKNRPKRRVAFPLLVWNPGVTRRVAPNHHESL